MANYGSNNVSILLSSHGGSFQSAVNYGALSNPTYIATGDFNGNGTTDLAVANDATNDVSILLGNGDGTFQVAVNYSVGNSPRSVATGDFNGDGHMDLAVVNINSNNISVLLGNSDATFQTAVNYDAGNGSTDPSGLRLPSADHTRTVPFRFAVILRERVIHHRLLGLQKPFYP